MLQHPIWQFFWHSTYGLFWHYICLYLSSFQPFILESVWHIFWHFLSIYLAFCLAVQNQTRHVAPVQVHSLLRSARVRQCPDLTASGVESWSPQEGARYHDKTWRPSPGRLRTNCFKRLKHFAKLYKLHKHCKMPAGELNLYAETNRPLTVATLLYQTFLKTRRACTIHKKHAKLLPIRPWRPSCSCHSWVTHAM